ncbi:hypothetical protein ABZ569_33430 [Streptomyces albus]|uniref:hypothetical protein n=1 Tax=Streptomyces albus TaxID=1888 RepID=UPI0033DB864A
MPTHYTDPHLACDRCGATVPRPAPGQYEKYESLHDDGWRWRGNPAERPLRFVPQTYVVSCPDCPPVI